MKHQRVQAQLINSRWFSMEKKTQYAILYIFLGLYLIICIMAEFLTFNTYIVLMITAI
jgi:hypothetical protein